MTGRIVTPLKLAAAVVDVAADGLREAAGDEVQVAVVVEVGERDGRREDVVVARVLAGVEDENGVAPPPFE